MAGCPVPKKVTYIVRRSRQDKELPTLQTAVRNFCIQCMGGEGNAIAVCSHTGCWLYPYRMGCSPESGRGKDYQKRGINLLKVEAYIRPHSSKGYSNRSDEGGKAYGSHQGKCPGCEVARRLGPHHLLPRQEGGDESPENLLQLCEDCHDILEIEQENDHTLRARESAIAFLLKVGDDCEEAQIERKDWHAWVYGGGKNPLCGNAS